MRKKYLSRILLGGLIIASTVTLNSCKDYDDDIDGLQEQIDSLSSSTDSDVSTIQSSISTLQSTASSLSSEIEDVQSDLADAQEELEAAIAAKASSDDVEALEDRVDALEIEVASLESSLASVQSAISALETALAEYATKEELVAQVTTLELAIQEASGYAKAAQSAADAAQATADENAEDIAELEKQLAQVQSDLEEAKTTLTNDILATVAETYVTKAQYEADSTLVSSLIESLTSRVGTNESSIDDLKTRIEALEVYEETLASLSTTISDAVTEAEEYADSLVSDLQAWIEEQYTTTEGLEDLVNDVDALNALFEGYDTTSTVQEKFDAISQSLIDINEQIEAINTSISEMYGIYNKQLKSLVFSPHLYWDGIEAIEVAYYYYEALQQDDVDAEIIVTDDKPYSMETVTYINVAPLVKAEYYLNPSNALIDEDASYYSYIVNHAKTVVSSRDLSASSIDIKSVERTDGVIEVSFKIQDAGLTELLANGDDEIDVAALQYTTEEDTVITSDFAALYIDQIDRLYINQTSQGTVDTEDATTHNHLAQTAAYAISDYENSGTDYPVLTVKYDETINLDEYINVHKASTTAGEYLWGGQATLAESDFYMTYELVGWVHGDNQTSESVHAKLSDEDGDGIKETLTPTGYNGASAITTAGRAPLVRVTLWDKNDASDEHIAAVGYIIVYITEEADAITSKVITLTDEYIVKCADEEVSTSWSDMEVELYTLVGMSKTSFENSYSLVVDDNDEAIQYQYDGENYSESSDYIGVITLTTTDDATTQTNVLKWAITQTEAYAAFVTNGLSSVSTYVKFTSVNASDPDIYVPLTWTPSNTISKQSISVVKSTTVSDSYWYDENSGNEGLNEVHWKIGRPTTVADTYGDFDPIILDNTFLTTPLTTVTTTYSTDFPELISSTDFAVEYYFVASSSQDVQTYTVADGTVYTVDVETNGNTTIGVTDANSNYYELATITDTTTGEITLTTDTDGLEVFKAIINAQTKDDLEHYLTFTLGLSVSTCSPAGTDFITITDQIDVVVLSPLFVTEAEISDMQWDAGNTLADQTVLIEVTDYNNYNYASFYAALESTSASWMIKYYGISSIELDVENATTNFATKSTNGEYIAVSSSDFTLTYTAASSVSAEKDSNGDFTGKLIGGTITLKQAENSPTSTAFTIKVPLIVTYSWGEIVSTYYIYVQSSPSLSTGNK